MVTDIYAQMLTNFGDTLEKTSEDTDEGAHPVGRGQFMTASQKKVVNFDKFKQSVATAFAMAVSPASCDALYMHTETDWFLIEFKNGKIDTKMQHQIKGKILHSLLLLTEKLNKTIDFTRNNVHFVLVYNEALEHTARISIGNSLCTLAGGTRFYPFGLDGLQKLYFKNVFAWGKEEFATAFVDTYCNNLYKPAPAPPVKSF
jgi:hypothetical protein